MADLVYVPLETPLLAAAKAHGLKPVEGLGMLLHQGRPGWKNKTEEGMNALRQECADLVAAEGGLACAFNSTVSPRLAFL